jgi:predicted Zn-dependent protease with MMP-like domain
MLYILRRYSSKSLSDRKQASRGLAEDNPLYRRKLYLKPISKADTKSVTVNIAVISAVGTHFYIQHKENKAFSTSIYKIDRIL